MNLKVRGDSTPPSSKKAQPHPIAAAAAKVGHEWTHRSIHNLRPHNPSRSPSFSRIHPPSKYKSMALYHAYKCCIPPEFGNESIAPQEFCVGDDESLPELVDHTDEPEASPQGFSPQQRKKTDSHCSPRYSFVTDYAQNAELPLYVGHEQPGSEYYYTSHAQYSFGRVDNPQSGGSGVI